MTFVRKILSPKEAERIQNEIFRKMSPERKIRLASQLILLAKKIKEAEEVIKKRK